MIASKGMGGTASVGSPEAGIAQVAQLHREADPVAIAAPLANRLPIWLGECAVPDQLFFGIWKCQQTFPLGGGQDRTTGHGTPLATEGLREGKNLRVAQTCNQSLRLLAIIF